MRQFLNHTADFDENLHENILLLYINPVVPKTTDVIEIMGKEIDFLFEREFGVVIYNINNLQFLNVDAKNYIKEWNQQHYEILKERKRGAIYISQCVHTRSLLSAIMKLDSPPYNIITVPNEDEAFKAASELIYS